MATLQELRESAGMSKSTLARRFGVTDRTIYAWENGAPVKRLVVHAYAGLFGVDVDSIDADIAP